MTEQLHSALKTSSLEEDPARRRRVDLLIDRAHRRYELPETLPGQKNSQEIVVDHETAAYLTPRAGGALSFVVDPGKIPNIAELDPDTESASFVKDLELMKSRLQASIERDLGFTVQSKVLDGQALLNSAIGVHSYAEIEDDPRARKNAAEAFFSEHPDPSNPEKKVSGWIEFQLFSRSDEGLVGAHLDPNLQEYLGALLAREMTEASEEPRVDIVLEDFTHKRPGQVVVASDNYNLAEELTTDSHKTIQDLDALIIQDRNKLINRSRRVGAAAVAWLRDKSDQMLAGNDDRLVYH